MRNYGSIACVMNKTERFSTFFLGKAYRHLSYFRPNSPIALGDIFIVLFGYQKKMNGCFGILIFEYDELLRFFDYFGWDFSFYNFAEDAIVHFGISINTSLFSDKAHKKAPT